MVPAEGKELRGGRASDPREPPGTRSEDKTRQDHGERQLRPEHKAAISLVNGRRSQKRQHSQRQASDVRYGEESVGEDEQESADAEEDGVDAEDAAPARRSGRRRARRISKAAAGRQVARKTPWSRCNADDEEDPSFRAGSSAEGSTSSSGEDSEPPDAKKLTGRGPVAVVKVGSRCLNTKPHCPYQ